MIIGLTKKDMDFLVYPSDEEVMDVGLRGIFLSNYFKYDGDYHAEIAEKHYNWETYSGNFDRTFRKSSNLDDMHENGIHDYLKFIKFGYGRATDHVSKDIRAGLMTRDEGIKRVNYYDPVKPSDLKRWLDYVGMDEDEFDRIADTFRDPRVWWYGNDTWKRQTLSGGQDEK